MSGITAITQNTAKVLNFGSLNLDYVYRVDHFVRAGETISSTGRDCFLGGKGLNQSIALARAGARVYHAGAVGRDGGPLIQVLNENNIDTSFVKIVDGPSGHAIIQLEPNGQNCIFLFAGANREISAEQIEYTISNFSEGDYLILQNEINEIDVIMKKAKERGMQVVLNPSPMDEQILAAPLELVDIFILNEVEARILCGESAPELIVETFEKKFPQAAVVLTLGEQGVWYQDTNSTKPLRRGIYEVAVADTTAAGDTFTGFFISAIVLGKSIETALEIASKAAALAVSKEGAEASIPTMTEVLETRLEPVLAV